MSTSRLPRLSLRRTCLVAAAVVAAGGITSLALPGSAGAAPLPGLPSVIPAWAATSQVLGVTPATQPVVVSLGLRGQDAAGLAAFSQAVSTPGTPSYHHFLTNAQFVSRFAAPASSGTAVMGWLRAAGVSDVTIDANHTLVTATMPAALATVLFGTTFEQVMHNVVSTRIPLTQPVLPKAIAPLVSVVSGLTQSRITADDAPAPVGSADDPNCSTSYGSNVAPTSMFPAYQLPSQTSAAAVPYVVCGYTPAQVRSAYGVSGLPHYDGTGVTVGIVDVYDATRVAGDTDTYSTHFGLPAVTYSDISPASLSSGTDDTSDRQNWAQEETLDWEAVHAIAPGARILYSGSVSNSIGDFANAIVAAIQNGAQEVSNSWGESGEDDPAVETMFNDYVTDYAASVGAGLEFSTGDAGDQVAATGIRQADFPAVSDGVTAVGGTSLEVGADGSYQGESYWGDYGALLKKDSSGNYSWAEQHTLFNSAGGGGVSVNYPEPAWQTGTVPASLADNADAGTSAAGRVIPDVSMLADGFLDGETYSSGKSTLYLYKSTGGTSVSSPLFGGMMALVVQAAGPQGNINPTLYSFHNGATRDPAIGRVGSFRPGGAAADTAADTLSDPDPDNGTEDPFASDSYYAAGPGGQPAIARVLAAASLNLYLLETGGNLSTLSDLPGYDDSTGLGSPNAPVFIQDFITATSTRAAAAAAAASAAASAAAASAAAASAAAASAAAAAAAANPAPIAAPVSAPVAACAVRASSITVTGPKFIDKYDQVKKFTFKLFIGNGTCKAPSSVGRKFNVYVDGHVVGTLRTGQHGTISHLYHLKGGRHVITARFPGNPDLKKSTSNAQVSHVS